MRGEMDSKGGQIGGIVGGEFPLSYILAMDLRQCCEIKQELGIDSEFFDLFYTKTRCGKDN